MLALFRFQDQREEIQHAGFTTIITTISIIAGNHHSTR